MEGRGSTGVQGWLRPEGVTVGDKNEKTKQNKQKTFRLQRSFWLVEVLATITRCSNSAKKRLRLAVRLAPGRQRDSTATALRGHPAGDGRRSEAVNSYKQQVSRPGVGALSCVRACVRVCWGGVEANALAPAPSCRANASHSGTIKVAPLRSERSREKPPSTGGGKDASSRHSPGRRRQDESAAVGWALAC